MQPFDGIEALNAAMRRLFRSRNRFQGILILGLLLLILKTLLGPTALGLIWELSYQVELGFASYWIYLFLIWGLLPAVLLTPIAVISAREVLSGENWPEPLLLAGQLFGPHGWATMTRLMGLIALTFGQAILIAIILSALFPGSLVVLLALIVVTISAGYRLAPRFGMALTAASIGERLGWQSADIRFLPVQGEVRRAIARLLFLSASMIALITLVGANSYFSAIVGDGIIILILAFSLAVMADVLAQAYATQTQAGLQYQSRPPSPSSRHGRPRPDRPSSRRPARGKRSPLPKPRSAGPPRDPVDIGPQGQGPEKPPSSWSGQGKYGGRKYGRGKKGKD